MEDIINDPPLLIRLKTANQVAAPPLHITEKRWLLTKFKKFQRFVPVNSIRYLRALPQCPSPSLLSTLVILH
jgi:hypothetical protein